jgi:hypothetical protein
MSIGEFHALPRHYAWKHEYWDGTTHIRPRELAVVATLPLHTIPDSSRTPPAGEVERLEALAEREGYESVEPILRLHETPRDKISSRTF